MENNKVFFAAEGQKGLNSTSAQHLCALASQLKDQAEAALRHVNFVTTKVDIIGSATEEKITSLGCTSEQFSELSNSIRICAEMNRLISWFSEARKALESEKNLFNYVTLEDWVAKNEMELPIVPIRPRAPKALTLDEIIDMMNVKERAEYLSLEAKAAVLGKFIHEGNPMETARTAMHEALVKPYSTIGNGRDMTIKHFVPSLDPKVVDDKFVELQAEFRATEQSLNHIKGELRNKLSALKVEQENTYRSECAEYSKSRALYDDQMIELQSKFNEWRVEEEKRLSKIKFVIPDALADTVTYLNNLAKK